VNDETTIIVECPHCHRGVARVKWGGGHALIVGGIVPEENRDGGYATSPGAPRMLSYVVDVDPERGKGRTRVVCNRRGHRDPKPSRVVTQQALDTSYLRLVAEGTHRVSWLELRA
jgi:hypothetical protein